MTTVFNPATGTKREFTEADLASIAGGGASAANVSAGLAQTPSPAAGAGSPTKSLADILALLTAGIVANDSRGTFEANSVVAVAAATSTQLLGAHGTRLRAYLTNLSTTDILYVRVGGAASLTSWTWRIPPGCSLLTDHGETGNNSITGYCATACSVQAGYIF